MGFAIMTSGGDSAGMNAAIKRAVDFAKEKGEQCYLIYDGLRGMIQDRIVPAERNLISGILHRGGTVIGSSRSKEFHDPEVRADAYRNLHSRGIDKLLVIGGDGSFRASGMISKESGVATAGIPATIDNDIALTDYCLGVDTALNVIRQAIDDIRDTASSFGRAFVVETMGRDCGYLAAVSALTAGAEFCIIPERPYDLESAARRIKADIARGRRYAIAVIAEGVGEGLSSKVVRWFEEEIGMESRLTVLGHIQRGGSPTVYDRRMGFLFATAAVESLCAGNSGMVAISKGGKVALETFDRVLANRYQMDPYICDMAGRLSR